MKIIKRIFKFFLILSGAILLLLLVAIGIDTYRTGYLKVKNIEFSDNDSYLIINVNIIPMNQDTVLTDKMVHVKDGVIQKIGDQIELEGVEIIDAGNRFLTPGLIDMHVHIWDRYELGLYLSKGITAVRNLWGMPMHLRIKQDVANDEIVSPLFYTTGPKLTGPEFIGDDNLNLTSPKEARDKVVSYKERGYDFIKTYYGLTPDIFDAVVEQSTISDMDVIAHPSQKVPYVYHFNPQIKSIEHTEDIIQQPLNYKLDTLKLEEVIIDFKNLNRGSFSPTLTGYYNIYNMLTNDAVLESEQLDYMNPLIRKVDSKAQFDRWYNTKLSDPNIVKSIKDQHDFHLYILKRLHQAGVRIVCSTDAGIGITTPGFSIHQELAFYKEAGLSNYEVLKTATINASETHSIMNNMGSIEEGKAANLLLLDRNPLEDLTALKNPSTVFIKGRKLNRETLDSFEEKAANRKNILVSAVRYAENLMIEK
ncbi:amidohydrolase family protein [Lutimonas zeaxanthinifaciens]|uniref:amidohydrolase family protein n=1 Tax=Lutimonas zeaxanthinifaciens TaxID=3060215 RepID=UPI00265CEBC2|nr:amidohydrolase family protein [Lutimonas sp. YSD2104]WKK67140.1 amidohydrolase family protein [Lutimonas sp. YSD2104]